MAELNFGTPESNPIIDSPVINEPQAVENVGDNEIAPINEGVKGLNPEELNDVAKIQVVVANTEAPVVILYGSPACGKTMTMVRLARYLQKNGYSVSPVRSFRPNYDTNYTELCDNFDKLVNSSDAATSTSRISFMLVNVVKNGKTICQIMEAPGEHYFNPEFPNEPYPRYLNVIMSNSKLRRIWLFMTEPVHTNKRMPDLSDRKNYVTKISKLKTKVSTKDRFVFVYNKIDETGFVISQGKVHQNQAMKDVANNYPNIFTPFANLNPIMKFIVPYRFDFVPFQTGDFGKASDNTIVFDEGPDDYPRNLWNVIMKNVRG